jgi:uncharacterized SAM-dependent methyltransferase
MEVVSFYKNSELAEEYSVSSMTISRYIEASKVGLNSLDLLKIGNEYKIKKSDLNHQIIKSLVNDKARFKNPPRFKTIIPTQNFNKKYSISNQLEIVRELKNKSTINLKFAYLAESHGAYSEYQKSRKKNTIRANILNNNLSFFIDYAKQNNVKYNIIELGSVDLNSTKKFINQLNKEKLIESFLSLDISKSLLKETNTEFKKEYQNLPFNESLLDIEQEDLYEIILQNKYLSSNHSKSVNIFLMIGVTASNLSAPSKVYRNISDALIKNDFFVIDLIKEYPEMEKNKLYNNESLYYRFISTVLFDLGFKIEDITIQSAYDKIKKERYVIAVLNENINLNFSYLKDPIVFKKGSEIILSVNRMNFAEELNLIQKYSFELVNLNSSIELDFVSCVFIKKKTNDI